MAAVPLRRGASLRCGGGEREQAAPDWASLHVDLTQLISARVLATGGFLDYVRFRAVCSQWRAAASSPRGRSLLDPRFHPRRWMLFPEGFGRFPGHRALGGHARFFDLSAAGPIVRVPLPELKDHCVLDSPDGLLLLQRDGDSAVRLLHPFTCDVAEFPDLECLAHQLYLMEYELTVESWYDFAGRLRNIARCLYEARKLCAAVNVTAMGAITVMLALHSIGRVAFASAGDAEWTISSWKMNQLDRALSYQGKLYVVNWEDGLTHVLQIDLPQLVPQCDEEEEEEEEEEEDSSPVLALPPPKTIATCSSEKIHLPCLVELDSEIMLVGYNDSSFSPILVLRLADLVLGRTAHVKSIGDHVLFVGARSLCVSPSWLPSIGGNSIVCFHAGENYLAQYHLGSGTWSVPVMDTSCLAPHRVPVASFITSLPVAIGNSGTKDCCFASRRNPNGGRCRGSGMGPDKLSRRRWSRYLHLHQKQKGAGFPSFACVSTVNLTLVFNCISQWLPGCALMNLHQYCRLSCNCVA